MTQQNHALAVSASGLRKSFDGKTVLDGIDLAIPAGTIFALLGPNGAGKTTTVQILSTLIPERKLLASPRQPQALLPEPLRRQLVLGHVAPNPTSLFCITIRSPVRSS